VLPTFDSFRHGLHIKIRPVTARKQHIISIIKKLKELKKARVVVAFDGQCILHAAAVENGEQMLANDYTGYVFFVFRQIL
jgi:phosphomannomutase